MVSKPQAKSKDQTSQSLPFEAQLLYQNIERLQTAVDETELLAIIADPGLSTPPTWAALYRFAIAGDDTQPASGEVVAVWPDAAVTPLADGDVLECSEFPLTAVWLSQPEAPLFIQDIEAHAPLPEPERWPACQTAALAILPLRLEAGEVWLVSLSWDTPHDVTPLAARLFETLARLAGSLIISQQMQATLAGIQAQQAAASRRIKTLAKTLPQPLAVIDSTGRHSYANQAYHDLLGYDFHHRGLVGQPVAVLFPPGDDDEPADDPAARVGTLLAGWAGPETLQRRDGSCFEANLIAWNIGDEAGSVAVYLEDLSQPEAAAQRKVPQDEAQAELQATRTGLEQELPAVEAELERHRETAAATLRATIEQMQREADTRLQEMEAKAKARQQQTQAQLEQLLALTSDWVWRIDANGQVTASSPRVEAFLGRPVETVIGQSIFELIHPSQRSQLHGRLMQQMVTQAPEALPGWTDLEISWKHREGYMRRSLSTLRPQFDKQGFLAGFQGIERPVGHAHVSTSTPDGELDRFETLAGIVALLEASPSAEACFAELVIFLQTQLGLAHVQIYTFDETTLQLVLHACAGEAAALLKMADHRIPLHHKKNLVAQAARHRQVMRVNDVRQEADFAVHPFMPDTRSQLSVPLTSGRQLVGVLDLHANQANRFDQADVELFRVLGVYLAHFMD